MDQSEFVKSLKGLGHTHGLEGVAKPPKADLKVVPRAETPAVPKPLPPGKPAA